jgi:putative ABC transport system permease protein
MDWVKRIKFGGLVDVVDENGESKGQGPVAGLSYELFSGDGGEVQRLDISKAIVKGKLPSNSMEILISDQFADNLGVSLGDELTYIGSTMNGSMAFSVFKISGTVQFGMPMMDKGTIIVDVSDVQSILDMEGGSSEILGFLDKDEYNEGKTVEIAETFNANYADSEDEFAPIMLPLKEQSGLGPLIETSKMMSGILISVFILAMSIVLWNTGLLAGIRRFKEFGIRLALGESKGHIYRTFTYEAILVGIIGSIVGTIMGLAGVYYLQVVGFDISGMTDQINSSLMLPTVLRSKVTWDLFFIGFIPGLFAMVLGNMLSGIGIYKRETASLMKELEV